MKIKKLLPEESQPTNEILLTFKIEKLVMDILYYCNRDDLPAALEFAIVELILQQIQGEEKETSGAIDDLDINTIKSIKMGETTYELNTKTKSSVDQGTAFIFDSLKPKLGIYVKVRSL